MMIYSPLKFLSRSFAYECIIFDFTQTLQPYILLYVNVLIQDLSTSLFTQPAALAIIGILSLLFSFESDVLVIFFRDTAGQERFRTITTAYYRGAMVRLH